MKNIDIKKTTQLSLKFLVSYKLKILIKSVLNSYNLTKLDSFLFTRHILHTKSNQRKYILRILLKLILKLFVFNKNHVKRYNTFVRAQELEIT